MQRLNLGQGEQAIGRLNAGEWHQFVLHAFNCNVHAIQRLRNRYNVTNITNDRACTGRI